MKPSLRLPFRLTFLLALGIFFPFLIPEWFDPDFRRTSSVGLMDVGYYQGKKRNKKSNRRRYKGEWKEPKLLTIYAVDEKGKKIKT